MFRDAIALAISLFLAMAVGGVGWVTFVGTAFTIFAPNIAEGAMFGALLFVVIFLVPYGVRQLIASVENWPIPEEPMTEWCAGYMMIVMRPDGGPWDRIVPGGPAREHE